MNTHATGLLLLSALVACSAPPQGGEWNKGDAPPPGTAISATGAPVAAAGYESVTLVDPATVTGSIAYTGTETDVIVGINQDADTCGPDHPERPAGALLVNDGQLENVVVFLEGIQSGKAYEEGPVKVDNLLCNFVPRVSIGHKGGHIVAQNSDPVTHNTNMSLMQNNSTIMNSSLKKGASSKPNKLKKTGVVRIQCDLHEWMVGAVFVHDSPYAVLSQADGSFSFTDVPAGEYTLKTWHEVLGDGPSVDVVVAANGALVQDLTFE
jgi:plastocyanin